MGGEFGISYGTRYLDDVIIRTLTFDHEKYCKDKQISCTLFSRCLANLRISVKSRTVISLFKHGCSDHQFGNWRSYI